MRHRAQQSARALLAVLLSSTSATNSFACRAIASLPSAIGRLKKVTNLSMQQCSNLDSLPEAVGDMEGLEVLSLHGCRKITALPAGICGLVALRCLTLDNSSNIVLTTAIDDLHSLEVRGGGDLARVACPAASAIVAKHARARKSFFRRRCSYCGKLGALDAPAFRSCYRCRMAYCSLDCQKKHWGNGGKHTGGHRDQCSAIRKTMRRTCDVCDSFGGDDQPPFPVCDACGARRYCGEECQRWDWEAGHAQTCPGLL